MNVQQQNTANEDQNQDHGQNDVQEATSKPFNINDMYMDYDGKWKHPCGIIFGPQRTGKATSMLSLLHSIQGQFVLAAMFSSVTEPYKEIFDTAWTFNDEDIAEQNLKRVLSVMMHIKTQYPNGINGKQMNCLIVIDECSNKSMMTSATLAKIICNGRNWNITLLIACANYHQITHTMRENCDFFIAKWTPKVEVVNEMYTDFWSFIGNQNEYHSIYSTATSNAIEKGGLVYANIRSQQIYSRHIAEHITVDFKMVNQIDHNIILQPSSHSKKGIGSCVPRRIYSIDEACVMNKLNDASTIKSSTPHELQQFNMKELYTNSQGQWLHPCGIIYGTDQANNNMFMIPLLNSIRDQFSWCLLFSSQDSNSHPYKSAFDPAWTFIHDDDNVDAHLNKIYKIMNHLKITNPQGVNGKSINCLIVLDGCGDSPIMKSAILSKIVSNGRNNNITLLSTFDNYKQISPVLRENCDFSIAAHDSNVQVREGLYEDFCCNDFWNFYDFDDIYGNITKNVRSNVGFVYTNVSSKCIIEKYFAYTTEIKSIICDFKMTNEDAYKDILERFPKLVGYFPHIVSTCKCQLSRENQNKNDLMGLSNIIKAGLTAREHARHDIHPFQLHLFKSFDMKERYTNSNNQWQHPFGIIYGPKRGGKTNQIISLLHSVREQFTLSVLFTTTNRSCGEYGEMFDPKWIFDEEENITEEKLKTTIAFMTHLKAQFPDGIDGTPLTFLIVMDDCGHLPLMKSATMSRLACCGRNDNITVLMTFQNKHNIDAILNENCDFFIAGQDYRLKTQQELYDYFWSDIGSFAQFLTIYLDEATPLGGLVYTNEPYNEMTSRYFVCKPDQLQPDFKLTTKAISI
jgi:hypothetical protein